MMRSVMTDRHVLNFVNSKNKNDRFCGDSLCQILLGGLMTMDSVSKQAMDFVDALCEQFPRLWFLSDRDVIELLSLRPTPAVLEPFVCKCFQGIRGLKVDGKSNSDTSDVADCCTLGIFSSFQEHVAFLSPVEPNGNSLVWLGAIEKQLKSTVVQLTKQCAAVRTQLEASKVGDVPCGKEAHTALDLLSEYPLQCLLVTEEALWCRAVLKAFRESSPAKLSSIKTYNSAKLKQLVHSVRPGLTGNTSQPLLSKYAAMCVRALVQLTMNHAQQLSRLEEIDGVPESSFEWMSMMKYHLTPESLKSRNDASCYVDVLGHRFQYGFEYFGPEDWIVSNPSTDRAMLGVLLALTSYRCGFVTGPSMSGKNKTVVQLGKALGRQVVTVQCFPSTTPGIVQKRLLGALYTGALLLLDSVDSLTQDALSLLAHSLVEIHQAFSDLTTNTQALNDKTKNGPADLESCMTFAGRRFPANINYGCVLISRRHPSEVPPSLQFATRPIALTRPDYRIIAEVMLTSAGFLEAPSLSQRLVSLISLAKDSSCLPRVLSYEQCGYLVVLQKIISASEIYLRQSLRQRETSSEVGGLSAEPVGPVASDNVPARRLEEDRKERLRRSCLSVKQGLVEETAIVKAILTVVVPVFYENKQASEFDIVFKDVFPMASQFPFFQQHIDEHEKSQLKHAVTEYLEAKQLQPDTGLIGDAVTLYQTLKVTRTVLLIGPPGCGKTTCLRALAEALSRLAADTPQPEAHLWTFVDTMVLFPNGLSHEQLFGCLCSKRGRQDGVLTRILTETQRRERCSELCSNEKKIVKWLIMDGEPVGQPGWLDCVTTLCSAGETPEPSQLHPKLLMEVTDLSEASPSAVTRCSLVHVRAADVWKAVWKREMEALRCDHRPDQRALKMWQRLAEDLFSSTLTFLRQKPFGSAMRIKGETHTCGLQEITSLVRILRALLHHYGKEEGKPPEVPRSHNTGTVSSICINDIIINILDCY